MKPLLSAQFCVTWQILNERVDIDKNQKQKLTTKKTSNQVIKMKKGGQTLVEKRLTINTKNNVDTDTNR